MDWPRLFAKVEKDYTGSKISLKVNLAKPWPTDSAVCTPSIPRRGRKIGGGNGMGRFGARWYGMQFRAG